MPTNNHFDLRRGLFWPRPWVSVSRTREGRAEAGYNGKAIADAGGKAIAGEHGFAKVGYRGVAMVGRYGTAMAGLEGTALAGEHGVILIEWYDRSTSRYRLAVGHVGEDGIQAHVAYKVAPATGGLVAV